VTADKINKFVCVQLCTIKSVYNIAIMIVMA